MPLSRDDGAPIGALCDDTAQMNIDFLFGLAVFLMAFLYVFTFIPGLFVPYQASAIDLSAVAYRTGAILAEDPGWYIIGATDMGDPAWETRTEAELARIGLAEDKLSPNVLSMDKIEKLKEYDYDVIQDKIGLAGTLTYDFGLNLTMRDTLSGNEVVLLDIMPPYKGQNVEYMERNVMIIAGQQLYLDCTPQGSSVKSMQLDIKDRLAGDNHDVNVTLFNIPVKANITEVISWADEDDDPATLNDLTVLPLVYIQDFIVRCNGALLPDYHELTIRPGDTVEVVIFNDSITSDIDSFWIKSDEAIFPVTTINYYNDPVYKLKDICNPGVLRVEVWVK